VFANGPKVGLSSRERALQVALKAETSAHDFYAKLVEQTEDRQLRRLYTELSVMEDGHVEFLQKILEESTTGGAKEVH